MNLFFPVLSRRGQANGTVPVFPGGAASRRRKILPMWPCGMPVFKAPARPAENLRSFSHYKSLPLGPAPSGQRATGQRRPDPSEEAPGPGDVATAQAAAAPQPATQPGVSWQGTAGGVICFLVSVFAQKKMHAVHARPGFAPQSRRAHGEGGSASEDQPLPASTLDSNLKPIPTFQRFPREGDEVAVNYGPPGDPEFWAAKVDKITLRSGKDAPPKQGTPPYSKIRVKFSDKTVTLGGSVFAGDQHGQGWLLLHAPPPSSASSAVSHFLNEGVSNWRQKSFASFMREAPNAPPPGASGHTAHRLTIPCASRRPLHPNSGGAARVEPIFP